MSLAASSLNRPTRRRSSARATPGPAGPRLVEVGDPSRDVGQVLEHLAGRAALEVDEEQAEVAGRLVGDEAGDERLDQLALAGTGGAADQAVRTVGHQVERERTVGRGPHHRLEGVPAVAAAVHGPLLLDPGGGHLVDAVGGQQRHEAGDRRRRGGRRRVAQRREGSGDGVRQGPVDAVGGEHLGRGLGIGEPEPGQRLGADLRAVGELGHHPALRRHPVSAVAQPEHGDADLGAPVEDLRDQVRIGLDQPVQHDEHPRPAAVDAVVGAGLAELGDVEHRLEQLVGRPAVAGQVGPADRRAGGVGVGHPPQPADEVHLG